DLPTPQRVVHGNESSLGQFGEHGLVVLQVARLVGVYEDEVERAVERGDGFDRGAEVEVDPPGIRTALDVAAGHGRRLLVDVAGDDRAARRKTRGHGQGRVPGERADLQHPASAQRKDEYLQEP